MELELELHILSMTSDKIVSRNLFKLFKSNEESVLLCFSFCSNGCPFFGNKRIFLNRIVKFFEMSNSNDRHLTSSVCRLASKSHASFAL